MGKHIPRLHCESLLATGRRVRLDGNPAHHLITVLRLKAGAPVILFDGTGGEYEASLVASGKQWVELETGAHHAVDRESALRITLAQAVSRGERMDYTLQKAVELGVCSIQPLDTERSQPRLDAGRQARKQRHWQDVVRSAAEQCGRDRLPVVQPLLSLADWLAQWPRDQPGLLLDPTAQAGLKDIQPAGQLTLLSGPEGGLSEGEGQMATHAGFVSVRLGTRILRTETAAIACIAAIQALWGDLG